MLMNRDEPDTEARLSGLDIPSPAVTVAVRPAEAACRVWTPRHRKGLLPIAACPVQFGFIEAASA